MIMMIMVVVITMMMGVIIMMMTKKKTANTTPNKQTGNHHIRDALILIEKHILAVLQHQFDHFVVVKDAGLDQLQVLHVAQDAALVLVTQLQVGHLAHLQSLKTVHPSRK